jgi:hypothetical protein
MSARTWHKGPPPHVGLWNASVSGWNDLWRWWDGNAWSQGELPHATARQAEKTAAAGDRHNPDAIQWTDYYPENARVPRVNPSASRVRAGRTA